MRTIIVVASLSFTCLAADTGRLKTEVEPGRAGVFIDGKFVGPARNFGVAQTYTVTPGEHEVKLVEPRYEDITTKVTITAGKKTVLNQTMKALPPAKPPFGRLRTENPDHFAAVYVNGHYMGHVDEFSNFAQGLLLNPGTYDVRIEPVNGQNPVTRSVTIEADKTVIVK
ncbi:MAG TPA: PEGA domain-containing protein [Bryobacteraceae bacterium]|nr:PEGA domain-containing protein [Bryobacteraceae bacterium]